MSKIEADGVKTTEKKKQSARHSIKIFQKWADFPVVLFLSVSEIFGVFTALGRLHNSKTSGTGFVHALALKTGNYSISSHLEIIFLKIVFRSVYF